MDNTKLNEKGCLVNSILPELELRIINYRPYKNFSTKKFKSSLVNQFRKEDFVSKDKGFEKFCNITLKVLNKQDPRKKTFAKSNQFPFMTKNLSKKVMKKSRLRHRFLKNNSLENRMLYTQGNYCVSLFRKTKIRYYTNLNEKKILDKKQFWTFIF